MAVLQTRPAEQAPPAAHRRSFTFPEAVSEAFNRYGHGTGRASRSEFWWFALYVALFNVAFGVVTWGLWAATSNSGVVVALLLVLAFLDAVLVTPLSALGVRRLHDVGLPGVLVVVWLAVLAIALLAGALHYLGNPSSALDAAGGALLVVWAVLMLLPGRRTPNRFGRGGSAATSLELAAGLGRVNGLGRWTRQHIIPVLGLLVLLYMFLPIFVVVLFSFNQPNGRYNYTWVQFSTHAWTNLCEVSGMCDALWLSLFIGLVATVGAVILGTLVAFALGRYRFRGRSGSNLLVFMPMATPEVVMGSSLLTLFVALSFARGVSTILIAHVMFCLSFVVVTVKARIASLDPRLEQAAMDLYADERTTFWKVTFPQVLPGIVGAALLAFSLSFDDFIVTNFNSGSTVTFPMFVWGAAQRGTPPQINVVGSLMFFISLAIVLVGQVVQRRRAARA
jgi:spermidine/putrescine transport system permease protein